MNDDSLQEYGCVKCQRTHVSNELDYKEHLDYQSKHGTKTHYHNWIQTDEWGSNCRCGAFKDY